MNRLIIKGVQLHIKEKGFIKQNIYINNGKIENISYEALDTIDKKYVSIIDGSNHIAIPGMIDVHTHVREPGMCHKENFRSASMAAAIGGVTTFFDMPNTIPPTIYYKNFLEKQVLAKTSIVDYGIYFGASDISHSKEIQNCITQSKQGNVLPPSIKIFLNETTGNLKIESTDKLEEIVQNAWFITAHAEEEKIETIISLTQKYKVPLYLVHISRKSEIDYIRSIKQKNQSTFSPIYVEVCPHHLAYTQEDRKYNPLLHMKPLLQNKSDCIALWDAINNNIVDSIGSDHAPHNLFEKKYALQNNKPLYGVPGLETSLLYLLDTFSKEKISLEKIISLCASNPAKIFTIKHKGNIEIGNDADIVLITINNNKIQHRNDMIISKAHWSIFDKKIFHYSIGATISNGVPVFLSHDLYKKYYNIKQNTVVLKSNILGYIFLNKGREINCHAKQS